jgi:hypothetical protein
MVMRDAEEFSKGEAAEGDDDDPVRRAVVAVVVPVGVAGDGNQQKREGDRDDTDRKPAEPDGVDEFAVVEQAPGVDKNGCEAGEHEQVRTSDGVPLQVLPLVSEIVAEKLRVRAADVGQQDAGDEDGAGDDQDDDREDEEDTPALPRQMVTHGQRGRAEAEEKGGEEEDDGALLEERPRYRHVVISQHAKRAGCSTLSGVHVDAAWQLSLIAAQREISLRPLCTR